MMKALLFLTLLTLTALVFTPLLALADTARIQKLETSLAERDRVILELLDRIEALEQRTGISPGRTTQKGPEGHGGPGTDVRDPSGDSTQTPGRVVVKHGEEERALERALTRDGVLLLPRGVLEVEPGITYSRKEDTSPRFLVSNGSLTAAETKSSVDSVTANLSLRYGLPWDSQVEIGLPYSWRNIETGTTAGFAPLDVSDRSGSGLRDLRIGFAKTLLREGLYRPDLIGRITWDTDFGDETDNGVPLGSGFHELTASLTAIKRQDPLVFVGGISYEHGFESNDVQAGAVIGLNFATYLAVSPETSLNFGFSMAHQAETTYLGREIPGSDRKIGTFSVGGSSLLAPGLLMNLSLGIGLTDDADDLALSMSFPFRVR